VTTSPGAGGAAGEDLRSAGQAFPDEQGDGSVRVMARLSGELTIKARRTRSRFQRVLGDNLRDAFRSCGLECELDEQWSRMFVRAPDASVLEPLARVFGLSSLSVLEAECEARLDEIVRVGQQRFAEQVRGKKYAVRARRSGRHPFRSIDVARELGAALNPGATVDLTHPDVVVHVEVRDDRALFFQRQLPAAGGLPLGVEGKAVALVSGGFDSCVAAWMALRRGVELEYVFCNLGGAAYRRLAVEAAKVLADRWSYGTRPRMHVLDFAPVAMEIRRAVRPAYQQIVLKCVMYRVACRVAEEIGAQAIVTGEAIGQVSSQTLTNLRAIEQAAWLPVLRPLVGFDKQEIIQRARHIGTYDRSARVREYCAISTGRPATAASPERVRVEDARVDPAVLEAVLNGREVIGLRDVSPPELAAAGLFVDQIQPEAVVLDTREPAAYDAWHWPGAIWRDFEELTLDFAELDRERSYVLVCAQGLRSAQLVERMQARGYEAYSFQGGLRKLRRLAIARGLVEGREAEGGSA